MQINLKAALLSALVLPGLGQLYKGCKLKGGVLIFLVNLFIIAALVVALQGVGEIVVSSRTAGAPQMHTVLENLRNENPGARWLLAGFLGLWLYGVIDALLAKKK